MALVKSPSYRNVALAVLLVSIVVDAVQIAVQPAFPLLLISNGACLSLLVGIARKYHHERTSGFDPIVAAETIVAFGVASLILGLVAGLWSLLQAPNGLAQLNDNTLQEVSKPFLEGLATAGLAPLVAMYLRISVAESEALADPTGDAASLGRAMSDLTRELIKAQASVTDLQGCMAATVVATSGFASSMGSETERLKLALLESQANIKSFGEAALSSRGEVSSLADETTRLKTASADASTLLEALAKLIESVERFVAPAGRR